jgi:AspT/YidE/YbjL antiporter-like protein
MDGLFGFLQNQSFLVIFGVVAIGMALGKLAIRGISLGSVVCIILAGLVTSIWAYNSAGVSLTLPDVPKTVFFNLFIFAMGVKIGPQFFAGLERDGWHMVAVGVIVAVLAPLLSYLCGWMFHLPQGAVAGVLAGSNNSSSAFGTASSALQSASGEMLGAASRDVVHRHALGGVRALLHRQRSAVCAVHEMAPECCAYRCTSRRSSVLGCGAQRTHRPAPQHCGSRRLRRRDHHRARLPCNRELDCGPDHRRDPRQSAERVH